MALNVGGYSQFYKGAQQLKKYGSGSGGKDTIVRYEFNTKDAHGNKVMDRMSREETLQVMKDISSQYGDNVIVEFSGDGLARLVDEGKPYSGRQLSEEEEAARAERQEEFNGDVVQMEGTRRTLQGTPEQNLSQKAKKLLDKLRKQYGNMDFFVSDKNSDMKSMLRSSNKEFSVIFSAEELEKMAEDEDYAKEQMGRVDQAIRMSREINRKYGYTSAYGQKGQAEITKIGIAVGDDGTMTFFAELEKSSAKQREYMERSRDRRAEDRKAAEKKADKKEKDRRRDEKTESDRMVVEASTIEELVWKMNRIDWSDPQKNRTEAGSRFNYSV